MAAVTLATRWGGVFVMAYVPINYRVQQFISAMSGSVLVAILTPLAIDGDMSARLALLTASGQTPQWQRHGLKASAALQPWLQALGAGGGSPLIAALEQARQWLQTRQQAHPNEAVRCLVFTDGRLQHSNTVQPMPCATLLVDMELAPVRLGRAQRLAEQLQADYQHLQQFKVMD